MAAAKAGKGQWCVERLPGKWYLNYKLSGDPRQRGAIPGATCLAEAETAAAEHRKRRGLVLQGVAPATILKAHLTVEEAVARFYEEEVEGKYKSWETVRGYGDRWVDTHGPVRLIDLTRRNVFEHIAKRRKGYSADGKRFVSVADGTIGNEIDHFKKVIHKAKRDWGVAVGDVDFTDLGLAGKVHRDVAPWSPAKVLGLAKHIKLYEPDFSPIVEFELQHAQRRDNILDLRWTDILPGGEHGIVRKEVKSKHNKLKTLTWDLTAKSRAIIDEQRGLHPTHVFTFLCKSTRPQLKRKKGVRYPVSENTFTRFWERTRADFGLPEGFRFHDLRHVLADLVLDATGDITAAQELLGHENVATTERYLRGGRSKRRANATKALGDVLGASNVVPLRRKAS